MVKSNQLSPGMTLMINKKLFRVESSVKVTVAKGNPFMKTKLRNLSTGKVAEKNFKLDQEVDEVTLKEYPLEFLYVEGKDYLFLNPKTLEQVLVPANVVGDKTNYLKEGIDVVASFYGDQVFSIDLPQFLELMIVQTDSGAVTQGNKKATLETGASIDVPSFVEIGDIIKVDTKSDEYIQRV